MKGLQSLILQFSKPNPHLLRRSTFKVDNEKQRLAIFALSSSLDTTINGFSNLVPFSMEDSHKNIGEGEETLPLNGLTSALYEQPLTTKFIFRWHVFVASTAIKLLESYQNDRYFSSYEYAGNVPLQNAKQMAYDATYKFSQKSFTLGTELIPSFSSNFLCDATHTIPEMSLTSDACQNADDHCCNPLYNTSFLPLREDSLFLNPESLSLASDACHDADACYVTPSSRDFFPLSTSLLSFSPSSQTYVASPTSFYSTSLKGHHLSDHGAILYTTSQQQQRQLISHEIYILLYLMVLLCNNLWRKFSFMIWILFSMASSPTSSLLTCPSTLIFTGYEVYVRNLFSAPLSCKMAHLYIGMELNILKSDLDPG